MHVKLRKDWEVVKVRVMYTGNKAKLQQHPKLAQSLISSKGDVHFGASSAFWCHWNARIMTLLREELKDKDQDKELIAKIWGEIEAYEDKERAKLK